MEPQGSSIAKAEPDQGEGWQLPVVERFVSVQGEGQHTGTPVMFIRLGGCDVGCPWCDTKESWDPSRHPNMKVHELVEEFQEEPLRTVIITGGEPTAHRLDPLTDELHRAGASIHLETSGAHPLSGRFDWICLSPKRFSPPYQAYYALADELKIVVHNERDLRWAEKEAGKVRADCKLFLQPQWGRVEQSSASILAYIRRNPQWRISLQTHKYLDLP